MSKKIKKTNAMRILDINKIEYTTKTYEFDGINFDGEKVAQQVGLPAEEVYKTLVVQEVQNTKNIFVCVIPVNKHLDLKALASYIGVKKLDMIAVNDILKITGYLRGGCTSLGMKKDYPTYIDSSVTNHEKVAVSAGLRGIQMYLSSKDLINITGAKLGEFTSDI